MGPWIGFPPIGGSDTAVTGSRAEAAETRDRLDNLLAEMLGPGSSFRAGQREAIEAVTVRNRRVLVVQRTGWGKSLVYWMAIRVRRDEGHGPALVISPLLALMRNQIAMANRLGLRAFTINSSNREEWDAAESALLEGTCDVLLISPERLANDDFLGRILPAIRGSIGLFVVDEAHCISDWGHDFRPDYRRIGRLLRTLPPGVPLIATTATANDRVVEDVAAQLGEGVEVIRGPLARSSLRLQAIRLRDSAERLAWLAEQVPALPGSGIVYCLTIADTERVARWLVERGLSAAAYHGQMSTAAQRIELEDALLANRLKVLVASSALGMGFDKPDLGFVIHFQRPGSIIAYYQQVGRAGRALDEAFGVLLSGREDDDIADYFIASAFPLTAHMNAVLSVLEGRAGGEGLSVHALEGMVNLKQSVLEKALQLLEIDGAVGHDRSRYFRTPNPWQPDTERIDKVTAARRRELAEMDEYVDHDGCLMEFLARALDDPGAQPCGRCRPEVAVLLPETAGSVTVNEAQAFLRHLDLPIEPRRRWPNGFGPKPGGAIEPPNNLGRALSVYGDAGYGRAVKEGKYLQHRFGQDLVEAAAELIQVRWRPLPVPEWVTAMPSRRHPGLVGDFARSLAERLGLPFADVLAAALVPEQKTMENSAQQVANVLASLCVVGDVPQGPVLLVDDIVDSRWTMTVAGWLLRTHGACAVHPFVLASASGRAAD
jgi:ATP-dependent DNA helicase RecQ